MVHPTDPTSTSEVSTTSHQGALVTCWALVQGAQQSCLLDCDKWGARLSSYILCYTASEDGQYSLSFIGLAPLAHALSLTFPWLSL